jgi:hypothetical protein
MKSHSHLCLCAKPTRGPTPTHRLLENQCAKMGPGIHWAVRRNHKLNQWVATAYYRHIAIAVSTRRDMGTAMRALLGKLFEIEGMGT